MMKVIILMGLVAGAFAAIGLVEDFTPENFKELAANPEELAKYHKCVVFDGPCTLVGKAFRDGIGLAVETKCEACTPKERIIVRLAARSAQENTPEILEKLLEKVDKDGKYREEFIKFVLADD